MEVSYIMCMLHTIANDGVIYRTVASAVSAVEAV